MRGDFKMLQIWTNVQAEETNVTRGRSVQIVTVPTAAHVQ